MLCKICNTQANELAAATVLNRHRVQYYRCPQCGFVQTEQPFWLKEAYSEAITKSDLGLVGRNVYFFEYARSLILAFFNDRGRFLDYGGGYGIFVRLMRDAGLDFYLYDQYCQNLFAQGFSVELLDKEPYEMVTAFEVFEHLVDPMPEIERMRSLSANILFSTTLVASPPPLPEEWWYYGLEHGQHVALYSLRSLEMIAQRLGLNFVTDGRMLHLFTSKKVSAWSFRMLLNRYVHAFAKRWLNRRLRGRSLLAPDYEKIAGRPLA
jgi:hypothetical protein